ncbi:MAG TPA: diacylglycerol kinase family protein [Thermoanaerobaculaceae bacterium]|nr:diacylglycerol kinase family protein [Thermoanaerobaculaceae bacterium]HRS17138.1 diacylglycerol kinase family protein [Thermoanaerobaculaceae bacterium]
MKILPCIVNPVSRGGRARPPQKALQSAAAECGWVLEWWPTRAPGHATELAARAAGAGHPIVAVWGGDGTYNEAARGLLNTDSALLILPGGTTSVLAFELGVPHRPVEALRLQLDGERRAMAAARTDRGQVFLIMLSAGPDSLILQRMPDLLKRRFGKVGIGVQAVAEFVRGRLPRFRVVLDDGEIDASWCIAGNARCYGGPYHATPGADPFSPGLEVVTLERHGRFAVVPFFFAIPRGTHLQRRGVTRRAVGTLRLEGPGDVPYQLDGDPAGFLPVTAFSTEDRVWVLLPRRAS